MRVEGRIATARFGATLSPKQSCVLHPVIRPYLSPLTVISYSHEPFRSARGREGGGLKEGGRWAPSFTPAPIRDSRHACIQLIVQYQHERQVCGLGGGKLGPTSELTAANSRGRGQRSRLKNRSAV